MTKKSCRTAGNVDVHISSVELYVAIADGQL